MLQDFFAAASVVLADHYVVVFSVVTLVAALCLMSQRKHSMTAAPGLMTLNRCAPLAAAA